MLLSQIAKVIGAKPLDGADHEIHHLVFDSRKIHSREHSLFFALSGDNHDGHHFIHHAYERGVRCFVVVKPSDTHLPDSLFLIVENPLKALQNLAKFHREQFRIPVIGITGSNGKTMIKEWLAEVMGVNMQVVKSPKSFNSQLGVPISVWQMSTSDEVGIFEAGISQVGEMEALQEIIQPTLGIFSNIGSAHDEGFDSISEKIQEKARLFSNSEKILCCSDHEFVMELKSIYPEKLLTWTLEGNEADFVFKKDNSGIQCTYQGQKYQFAVSSQGYYLENILFVISMALFLGLDENDINLGLKSIKSVPMRLELKRGVNDCYVIDDSYNNDLIGLSIALDYLEAQPRKQRRTVILSDITQSGLPEADLYQRVNDLLQSHNVSRLIGIGPSIRANERSFTIPSTFYTNTAELLANVPGFSNEMILVKGARSFELERVVAVLEEQNHGTVLEVNFESLTHNLNVYRSFLNDETKLMVMVKAFAYGGGLSEVAHLLQYEKVDYLGVAYTDEGVALRQQGIKLPIMVMNPDWNHFSILSSFNLEPEIYSLEMLRAYIDSDENTSPIHVKIDTGMNRLGFREEDLNEMILILKSASIQVKGILTHFAGSEDQAHDEFSKSQGDRFVQICDKLVDSLGYSPIRYALNSSGIVRWPQYHLDMVRLGIGLYGYDSTGLLDKVRPISRLKSRVSQVRKIRKGESVGYSRNGTAKRDSEIAVVSVGYADGYLRKFGNGVGYMIVNGQKANTIGNVCMDMTMLDVTGLGVKAGDEVIVFGDSPSIEELATWADTIPYEILTNVSQRVKRVFVSE